MALSSKAVLSTSALLLAQGCTAYLQFPVYDSTFMPTDFKDGTPTYAKVTRDFDEGPKLEQFLLCTSCTVSYIFGTIDDLDTVVKSQEMEFTEGVGPIPVNFITVNLQLYAQDDAETPYSWEMDVAYIDPFYASPQYFVNYKENMLGLAPMASTDPALQRRQFLYQFVNADSQKGLNLEESYAFNAGEFFALGGSQEDFERDICSDGKDITSEFNNKGAKIDEEVFPEATEDMAFTSMLYYRGADLNMKISNYKPPVTQMAGEQVLAVDTWNREMQMPTFMHDYLMDTFMLPAYTCDKMRPQDLAYPGIDETRACYCNNGDYHAMPTINLEISKQNFQYDIGPDAYMFAPYINYTQPMSLCVLAVQEGHHNLPGGIQYVALGQRNMNFLPFYTVYDRETGTAVVELGGATYLEDPEKVGTAVAVTIAMIGFFAVMFVYLCYLRYAREQAEAWLEANKSVLFTFAKDLKTEDEILDELAHYADDGKTLPTSKYSGKAGTPKTDPTLQKNLLADQ